MASSDTYLATLGKGACTFFLMQLHTFVTLSSGMGYEAGGFQQTFRGGSSLHMAAGFVGCHCMRSIVSGDG